jgi:hypothetical protein
MTPAIGRLVRVGIASAFSLGLVAFLLFGQVTVGVGIQAGTRQRVAAINESADAAMAAVGISGGWRTFAWSSAAIALLATLALIWYAMRPADEGD